MTATTTTPSRSKDRIDRICRVQARLSGLGCEHVPGSLIVHRLDELEEAVLAVNEAKEGELKAPLGAALDHLYALVKPDLELIHEERLYEEPYTTKASAGNFLQTSFVISQMAKNNAVIFDLEYRIVRGHLYTRIQLWNLSEIAKKVILELAKPGLVTTNFRSLGTTWFDEDDNEFEVRGSYNL